ncbi:MAG TPA: hypothetical protein VGL97_03060 [Bryobacteraceae bacterium]|jgi:photosystem II stability/assembly factor-like uncharacterized protein
MIHAALLVLAWAQQPSGTTASLRGLDAVSPQVVWASGTKGTYLVTTDGGSHWRSGIVPGAESLDFRDVEAFDANTAYLLLSGMDAASRLYRTDDGGGHWQLLFTNPDANGFLDALAFWDRRHGIILGDPVDGHFAIFTTEDGGTLWQRRQTPLALREEGAFAASGTCLITQGRRNAWFATGGPGAARVFRSSDRGKSWKVSPTPLSGGVKSAGIFSLAFSDARHGIAVGGDYQDPRAGIHTIALTTDAGKTWAAPDGGALRGYRSAVVFVGSDRVIAVGSSGSDISRDGGQHWQAISDVGFNAVAAAGNNVWAAGAKGIITKLTSEVP